jgi:hypothetical protein
MDAITEMIIQLRVCPLTISPTRLNHAPLRPQLSHINARYVPRRQRGILAGLFSELIFFCGIIFCFWGGFEGFWFAKGNAGLGS